MGLSIGPTIGVEGGDKFRLEFKEIAATAEMLQSKMDALTSSFTQFDSAMEKNRQVANNLKNQITNQEIAVRKAEEGYQLANKALEENEKHLEDTKRTLELVKPSVEGQTKAVEEATQKVNEQSQVVDEAKQRYEEARQRVRELGDSYKEWKNKTEAHRDELKDHQKVLVDAINEEKRKVEEIVNKYGEGSKEAQQATKESEKKIAELTKELEDNKREVNNLNSELKTNKELYGMQSETMKGARSARDQLKSSLKEEEKVLKDLSKEQKTQEELLKGVQHEVSDLEKEIDATDKKIDVAKVTLVQWENVLYTAKAKLNELITELRETPGALESFLDSMQKVGDGLEKIGETITKYVTTPLVALATYGVKNASDFTDAIAKISTIADESKVSLDEFREGIINLANETGFSTEDIAAATYQALSAAVDTEESLEFVAGAADLARAGFLDMYGSVDVLTTILNAYGKSVDEVDHISDVLVKTQDLGKTTVNELAASMGNVIPTAAQYGISLEDLSTAYVVLTRQGINTTRATTYLRSAFTELEKTDSDASNALKKGTGKTFMQLMEAGWSLGDVMQALRESVNNDDEAFIHLFGSIRTAAGALALANTSSEEYASILDEVSNSVGQASRNVEKLQTPSLKWKKAWEQLKNTALDLGQVLMDMAYPYFLKVVEAIKKFTTWMKNLSTPAKQAIIKIGAITAAVGPLIATLGKATSGIATIALKILLFKKNFGAATTGLAGFANKMLSFTSTLAPWIAGITLASIAITALGTALYETKAAEIEEIREQYALSEATQEAVDSIKELTDSYEEYREAAVEKIKNAEVDAEVVTTLRDKYNELLDAEGNVKTGSEELAAFYKESLAEAMNTSVEDLDTMIGEYGSLNAAVDAYIENLKREAQMEAYKELLIEATKTYTQAQKDYNDVIGERNQAYNDWIDIEAEAKRAQEEYTQAQIDGAENTELLRQKFERLNEEAGAAKNKYLDLNDATSEAGATMSKAQSDIDTITKVMAGELDPTVNELTESTEELGDTAEETGEKIVDSAENKGEEAKKAAEKKLDETKRMTKNKMADIAANFDIDLTEQGNQTIGSFINTFDSAENMMRLQRKAAAVAKVAKSSMENYLEIGSPSKVFRRIGNYTTEGFILGLGDDLKTVSSMGQALADASVPSMVSNYTRTPYGEYGTTTNTRNISAPIAVNVNVNGNVDDTQALVDQIEQMLVEKIVRNERVFA